MLSTLAGDKAGASRSANMERDDMDKGQQENDSEGGQMQDDIQNAQAIRAIREMVPNYPVDLDGKTFLNQGALTELDGNDYRPLQRVFFFLLNDVLIICKVKHDK